MSQASRLPPAHAEMRVLVTRASHQASALGDALAALGLLVINIPTIAMEPPTDAYRSMHRELQRIDQYDWLLFTSANAVAVFAQQQQSMEVDEIPCRIASIGAATSRAVAQAGLQVDLQPSVAVAEDFARALQPHAPGSRMLLVRAESAREVVETSLERAGAEVVVATAYRTVIPDGSADRLKQELPRLSAITLASSSAVRNLLELCDAAGLTLPMHIALASIGPVTSSTLRESGYTPSIEASSAQVEVLASELARFLRNR